MANSVLSAALLATVNLREGLGMGVFFPLWTTHANIGLMRRLWSLPPEILRMIFRDVIAAQTYRVRDVIWRDVYWGLPRPSSDPPRAFPSAPVGYRHCALFAVNYEIRAHALDLWHHIGPTFRIIPFQDMDYLGKFVRPTPKWITTAVMKVVRARVFRCGGAKAWLKFFVIQKVWELLPPRERVGDLVTLYNEIGEEAGLEDQVWFARAIRGLLNSQLCYEERQHLRFKLGKVERAIRRLRVPPRKRGLRNKGRPRFRENLARN